MFFFSEPRARSLELNDKYPGKSGHDSAAEPEPESASEPEPEAESEPEPESEPESEPENSADEDFELIADGDAASPRAAARTQLRQGRRVEKSVGPQPYVKTSLDIGISYVKTSVSASYRKRRETDEKVCLYLSSALWSQIRLFSAG